MSNDEHVAMLKQGVDALNEWRDQIPNRDVSGMSQMASENQIETTPRRDPPAPGRQAAAFLIVSM